MSETWRPGLEYDGYTNDFRPIRRVGKIHRLEAKAIAYQLAAEKLAEENAVLKKRIAELELCAHVDGTECS